MKWCRWHFALSLFCVSFACLLSKTVADSSAQQCLESIMNKTRKGIRSCVVSYLYQVSQKLAKKINSLPFLKESKE